MKLRQFTIGQMFLVATLIAVEIVTLQQVSLHLPWFFSYALIASLTVTLLLMMFVLQN